MIKEINNRNQNIEIGKEYRLDFDDRYFLQSAQAAMKDDIIRGLVELITNCDDSYNELEKSDKSTTGVIEISIIRKRKGQNSFIKVLDNAEGMFMSEMVTKLKRLGGMTSGFTKSVGKGKRGFMGRGAKECVIFGNLRFQSIKNDEYSEIELKKPTVFKPIMQKKATLAERIDLGIDVGNGTLVTLEVEPQFSIPSHESLVKDLPRYYSLRDIAAELNRKLILVDGNNPEKRTKLQYNYPQGEVVFDDKIDIPDYPEAETHLIIKKTKNRIKNDSGSPYWEGGILIKSNHAIHGIASLSKKIENNPYFDFYFGKITCPYIDRLATDYEGIEKNKSRRPLEKNPSRIIDPLRSEGLAKNHPFTKSLYLEIEKHINIQLKKDEDSTKQKNKEIENNKTKDRFRKLANEASKYIKEQTEGFETEDETYLTETEIKSKGMVVIPGGLKIPLNEERKIYVYCYSSPEQKEKHVIVSTDSDAIRLNTEIINLVDRGNGILVGLLFVEGLKEDSIKIKLTWGNVDKYLPVSVIANTEVIQDIKEFQFEKDNYSVKEGKKKILRIFAYWPEFIHGKVKLKISIRDKKCCKLLTENIILDYDHKLKEVFGRKLAVGTVKIAGLKAGGPTILSAILQDKEISTNIRVVPKKDLGKDFEIKIVDEDLGDQRSVLVENILKINGRHENIKRYLGSGPDFIGQDSIHFRLLMAELIADTVARIVLELNAQKNAVEYKDLDATAFYRKHRGFMNAFLEKSHRIQISDSEIDIFKKN